MIATGKDWQGFNGIPMRSCTKLLQNCTRHAKRIRNSLRKAKHARIRLLKQTRSLLRKAGHPRYRLAKARQQICSARGIFTLGTFTMGGVMAKQSGLTDASTAERRRFLFFTR